MDQVRSGEQVIRRKVVVPPLPEQLVSRPRLTELLVGLVHRQQVVRSCATAGAGKTTAVADACRQFGLPVAWLTVDTSDVAPGRLVTYLEAAFARLDPGLAGYATSALNAGIAHVEAAGLLSEEAGRAPVVLVLDDLERLGEDPAAWAVLEALVRYAPRGMRVVMLSRRDIPAQVCALPARTGIGIVGEPDLAFTQAEAAMALELRRAPEVDAAAAVDATGGWVTGVLFEAWRSAEHVRGTGGEGDPLYGYLSSHILNALAPDEREFLVVTSVLDEVTAPRAEALGIQDTGRLMRRLAQAHLPVSWTAGGDAMRCHQRFHEYLVSLLAPRGSAELRRLRLLHGRRLAAEGHHEEATELLLEAEAPAEAVAAAEQAIFEVIERLDFPVAQRWLAALTPVCPPGANILTTAALMLAVVQDDYGRAVRLADHLEEIGQRQALAAASAQAAALLGWCYNHLARLDDVRAVLDAAAPGPEVDTVSYCASLLIDFPDRPRPEPPAPTGGPLDAIPYAASYYLGRLDDAIDIPASPWAETLSRPYRIAVLRARGQTQEALRLYETAKAAAAESGPLHAAIGPELLIDIGQLDAAATEIARGRKLALASGSLAFQSLNVIVAMKHAVRRESDPAIALRVLDRLDRGSPVRRFQFTAELRDMWYGFTLLKLGRDTDALVRLRRATHGMIAGGRTLDLPAAAVYLAEAEWRAGNEDAADHAAGIALATAHGQGSNYLLLQALEDFPAVMSRQIDAQDDPDSEWHELGRALITHATPTAEIPARPRVQLTEFGKPALRADGVEVQPGLAKSYELLAFLCAHNGAADRTALLHALFDGHITKSARSYLRQALRRLSAVLPDNAALAVTDDHVRLVTAVDCESVQVERQIAATAGLKGKARLDAILRALTTYDQGPYLVDTTTAWADTRRRRLDKIAVDARYEAADLAYSLGRLPDARVLAERTVRDDPCREAAWRLIMRVAHALGDDSGVLAAYRACEGALGELSMTPTPTTRRLFDGLRR